jgi:hypothetical protein
MAVDGLEALNDMISSWSNDSMLIYARTWENFSITAASSYLIGASQTLNTVKPMKIIAAYTRSGDIDYPMTPMTDEEYYALQDKSSSSPFPDFFSYDNGHPYGRLRFYPAYSTSASLYLLTEKVLTNFASLSTTVDLPSGWNKAIKYNLAIDIAPEYGVSVTPEVIKGAKESLNNISLAIARNRGMKYSGGSTISGNIYTGF